MRDCWGFKKEKKRKGKEQRETKRDRESNNNKKIYRAH